MPKLEVVHIPRLYRSRFSGPVLLACGKCQGKLKREGEPLKIKRLAKRLAKAAGDQRPGFAVVKASCMKLCPKGGVAVCPPSQLASGVPLLRIVYNEAELSELWLSETASPQA